MPQLLEQYEPQEVSAGQEGHLAAAPPMACCNSSRFRMVTWPGASCCESFWRNKPFNFSLFIF